MGTNNNSGPICSTKKAHDKFKADNRKVDRRK